MFNYRYFLQCNISLLKLIRLINNYSKQSSAFPYLPTNKLPSKPNRKKGITEIRGPYYFPVTRTYLDELLQDWGEYVDGIKFAGGSFSLMPENRLRDLIDIAHKHNCYVSTGGYIERNGAFAEYALINADFVIKLPDGLDPLNAAPLYCGGVSMYKALKVSQARSNDWISIVGVGGLGSLGIRYAKIMGFRVIGIVAEKDQAAVDLAREMGADEVYDGSSDQHSNFVKEKTNGGVQAALVTVPLVSAYEQALQSLKQGGRLVMIGIPTDNLSISIGICIARQIEIVGTLVGTRTDLKETLDIAQKYDIKCKVQTCQLEQVNDILDDMRNYRLTGRMVIDFTGNSK
ncbi:unnamed protein product [Adineta steineri]|uniref:Alcohol dehydrogenase-like C-terminal domain-containing protein n=1 Tax=Adineta steineri TaxID=433720 RepID=A0A814Z5U0_9BILA|nr:unnamed protein product [Adineta steineri]